MTETALDRAHAQMEQSDAKRLAFFERVADSELFLLLQSEAEGDQLTPEVFDLGDAQYVLVFDREDRLSSFAGRIVPYAALSGRVIAQMLAGQSVGLGINLDVAPSATLLPAEAVTWLAETLAHTPDEVEARPVEVTPPAGLPDTLIAALDTKLATAVGLASMAYLVGVAYEGGAKSHMLAFIGAAPGAEDALAKAVSEALTFSGIEAGALDVAFFKASDPMAARLARVGLRFDLPQPEEPEERAAPGSDPDAPPILR
ncbi:SseB family protein [Cognatishimia sp. MH4019]|uniref:SseB family protein n=1 Tax=Cognatishimia sp. MH4019 TaxID=2854030 RepID=UPI001CD52C06|nr:SseB family protein [Cognatishimia sp. MH4019]